MNEKYIDCDRKCQKCQRMMKGSNSMLKCTDPDETIGRSKWQALYNRTNITITLRRTPIPILNINYSCTPTGYLLSPLPRTRILPYMSIIHPLNRLWIPSPTTTSLIFIFVFANCKIGRARYRKLIRLEAFTNGFTLIFIIVCSYKMLGLINVPRRTTLLPRPHPFSFFCKLILHH